jgi:hypothetical protein
MNHSLCLRARTLHSSFWKYISRVKHLPQYIVNFNGRGVSTYTWKIQMEWSLHVCKHTLDTHWLDLLFTTALWEELLVCLVYKWQSEVKCFAQDHKHEDKLNACVFFSIKMFPHFDNDLLSPFHLRLLLALWEFKNNFFLMEQMIFWGGRKCGKFQLIQRKNYQQFYNSEMTFSHIFSVYTMHGYKCMLSMYADIYNTCIHHILKNKKWD